MHAAAEHHVSALVKQVSHSLTVAHAWVGDRAHGTGKLGTDAGDTAEVFTDGFCARLAIDRSIHYHSNARLGTAGRTGMSAESQGITWVTQYTRNRRRLIIASSSSIRLSEKL